MEYLGIFSMHWKSLQLGCILGRSKRNEKIFEKKVRKMDTFDVNDIASWFRCSISREDAENLLMRETQNGVFLVRDSSTSVGDFVLSVKIGDSVQHYTIEVKELDTPTREIVYKSGIKLFSSFPNLLEHFKYYPLESTETKLVRPSQMRLHPARLSKSTFNRLSKSIALPIEVTVVTAYVPMAYEFGALELEVGDQIFVTDMEPCGIWKGITKDGTREGYFPFVHVSLPLA